jgi:thiosulfate/3-mercaptopyruvate sulfurtransferase
VTGDEHASVRHDAGMPAELQLPGVVVDAAWVGDRLDRSELIVADVRWYLDGRSGRDAHLGGHLPGAVFIDLDADLTGHGEPSTAGRHPLPSTAAFAAALGRRGVGDGAVVVAYDDTGGMSAARLVWMLRACGHPAAVLDGGIRAWPGPLQTGAGDALPAAKLSVPGDWPAQRLAGLDDVAAAVRRQGSVLLDARAPERYRGDHQPVDARPGHIPGARNAPWDANLDGDRRFLPRQALADRYAALGAGGGSDVVVSCGSGVSACVDLLALEHAGLGGGRLFVPGWSGWSADPRRPAARGEE